MPVAPDELTDRAGNRFDLGIVGPPLRDVFGAADDLEDHLGRGVDVDLSFDAAVLHALHSSSMRNVWLHVTLTERPPLRNHWLLIGTRNWPGGGRGYRTATATRPRVGASVCWRTGSICPDCRQVGPGVRIAGVDHCYVGLTGRQQPHEPLRGHWTGPAAPCPGRCVAWTSSPQWQVLTTDPDANFEWEVHVPRSALRPVALAHQGSAYAVPRRRSGAGRGAGRDPALSRGLANGGLTAGRPAAGP